MKHNLLIKMLSMLLLLATLVTALPMQAFADTIQEEEELYLKSVRVATAKSPEEARRQLEAEGYIFLEENLNEGTKGNGVYLGYTTTTDPAEAIYDMKLMNMNGGYSLTSMLKALLEHKTAFSEMAYDLILLASEFVLAFYDGSVPAKKAYKALNFFRMVDDEGDVLEEKNGLGYQLVNGVIGFEEVTEIILFCDPAVVDSIVKILTMGIQGRNENWIQKLSEVGPHDSDMEYELEIDEEELHRRAEQLLPILQLYAQAYNAMAATGIVSGEFDENFEIQNADIKEDYRIEAEDSVIKNLDISRYKSYKLAFDELAKYKYGDGTLKDFFCSLEDSSDVEQLYPLVSVLTNGEYSALSYGCVLEIILGADVTEDDFTQYDEVYEAATAEVKSFYLYSGVDKALLQDDAVVAFTDEANRHMAATGEMEFFENETDAEDTWENGKNAALMVGAIGMGVLATAKLYAFGTMLFTWTWSTTALAASSGFVGVSMKACVAMSGPWAMVVVLAAAVVVAVVSFVIAAFQEWKDGQIDWDDKPIPDYIYDVKDISIIQTSDDGDVAATYLKTPSFVFYEAVRDIYGDPADLNGRSGNASQWLALYVSYDALGDDAKPIKASALTVKHGDGETPEGTVPLSEFGEVIAQNLNSYNNFDSVNGIYFFYEQDAEVVVDSGKKYYISDIYLQAGESPEHCIQLLEAAGYTPINTNLSPHYFDDGSFFSNGSYVYSYIGYKLTTNKRSAIRDIRMAYDYNASPTTFGGASYAECGSSAGVTLYATEYECAGTPILAGGLIVLNDEDEVPTGYEPVNFFSGGPAVSFNRFEDGGRKVFDNSGLYLYFLPETTFTEGEPYLGGIAYFEGDEKAFSSPIWSWDFGAYIKGVLNKLAGKELEIDSQTTGKKLMNTYYLHDLGYDYAVSGEGPYTKTFLLYQTYNPYRAIYDLKATDYKDFPDMITAESLGYAEINTWKVHQVERPKLHPSDPISYWYKYTQGYDLDGNLYVTGNTSGNTYKESKDEMSKTQPIKMSEFVCVHKDTDTSLLPDKEMGFEPISDMYKTTSDIVTLEDHRFYVANREKEELPYVSNIYSIDTVRLAQMYGGADANISLDMIGNPLLLTALGSQGATHYCSHVPEMWGWNSEEFSSGMAGSKLSEFYFAYSKTSKKSAALRDMFLYYDGLTSNTPPDKLYRGSVKYELLCEINYNFTGYDDAVAPRVYLYGTTDRDAGERIIDFTVSDSPFKEGYETVRTMNGRSLVGEIVDAIKSENKNNVLYASNGNLFSHWISFFTKHLNDNDPIPAHGAYYLHFKREGDEDVSQKYISELYLTKVDGLKVHSLDDLFDQGAEGYVNKNLNASTFGDDIYLGYSYTTDASKAITSIRASHSKSHPKEKTDKNGVTYQLVDGIDLNDGAAGDYIYLYYTKSQDKSAGTPITKLSCSGSVKNQKTDTEEIKTVLRWNSTKASDLNDGCGFWSDYIYLLMTRPFDYSSSVAEEEVDYGRDKTYTRKEIDGSEQGKYIAAVYVMDKNTIRQEKLAAGVASDKCECSDISDEEVFERLKKMGATTIIETPICLSTQSAIYDYLWEGNDNKVFIGYSRTDTLRKAVKGITISVELLSDSAPADSIVIDRRTYDVVAEAASKVPELPAPINLIGMEDTQDKVVPRMYLYTTTSGDTPIYDICIDKNPIMDGWNTVRGESGDSAFVEIYKDAKNAMTAIEDDVLDYSWWDGSAAFGRKSLHDFIRNLKDNYFDPDGGRLTPFYIHCKMFEGETIEETKPYIGEIYIAKGDSKKEALANLLSFDPDGYIDCDLNKDAGGNYIYMGFKHVDNGSYNEKAITDLVVYQGKNPAKSRRIYLDSGSSIKYDLVSTIDLNDDAGGEYLYLYSTTSTLAGTPIVDLRISVDKTVNHKVDCYKESTVVRADTKGYTNEYIDLNKDAGGDYIYLVTKEIDHTAAGPVVENHIDATCGEDGSYDLVVYCIDCGTKLSSASVTIPATGDHMDGDDHDHDCDVCGEQDIEGHAEGEPVEEDRIEATADTDGSYNLVVHCTECGEVISTTSVVIPATGADEEPENTESGEDINEGEGEDEGDAEPENPNDKLPASLFGNGSVIAICAFVVIAALAAAFAVIKKKKNGNDGE